MKNKPRQRLSPRQEKYFYRFCLAAVLVCLLWIVFSPRGIWKLVRRNAELKNIQQEISSFEKENKNLEQQIEKLNNDPTYLEKIAREVYGLLRKNERIFVPSKSSEKNKEDIK